MKTVSLSGSSRENVGKKGAATLRREGNIPSVLYGGKEQIHFFIPENEAKKLVFTLLPIFGIMKKSLCLLKNNE